MLRLQMDFPHREVNATDLNLNRVELSFQQSLEVIDLSLQVILQATLANLLMNAFIEPFNDGVFDLTHSLKIGKVLFQLVSVRSHALQSVVVPNILLIR